MHAKVPSRAPGESSPELEGVEGTSPNLGNQASVICLTTEKKTIINIYFLSYIAKKVICK